MAFKLIYEICVKILIEKLRRENDFMVCGNEKANLSSSKGVGGSDQICLLKHSFLFFFFLNSFISLWSKIENTIVCTVFANSQQGSLALIILMKSWCCSCLSVFITAPSQVVLVVRKLPASAGGVRDQDLWVGNIPWSGAWPRIAVFLPGEPPWTE